MENADMMGDGRYWWPCHPVLQSSRIVAQQIARGAALQGTWCVSRDEVVARVSSGQVVKPKQVEGKKRHWSAI
jgi:hypothetical protein